MIGKKSHKFFVIQILLIITLMISGVSYAWWTENLTITGEITTSDFDTEFSLPGSGLFKGDNEPGSLWWHRVLSPVDLLKDVADITDVDIIDGNTISIVVENAYPGYEAWAKFGWVCRSTVPAHVREVTYEARNESGVLANDEIQLLIVPDTGFPQLLDVQLHAFEEWFGWLHIYIFEDDAAGILPQQTHTYTITITIHTIQYNYPGP